MKFRFHFGKIGISIEFPSVNIKGIEPIATIVIPLFCFDDSISEHTPFLLLRMSLLASFIQRSDSKNRTENTCSGKGGLTECL